MLKLSLKKLLLGSLVALQLTNNFNGNTLNEVYAKEIQEDQIYLNENGKILQLVGIKINGYDTITFGYIYVKGDSVYLKDAIDGRIYNLTKISKNYICIEGIYDDAFRFLTDEQIARGYITRNEATEIVKSFDIIRNDVKVHALNDKGWEYLEYYTFGKENFDNSELYVANSYGFKINDKYDYEMYSWATSNDYDENLAQDDTIDNNYKLGILERYEEYPYYTNIYQETPEGTTDQMGIVTGYHVLDENGKRIAILQTQEEVDDFIELHHDELDNYTWKASYYNGTDAEGVLEAIDNNQPISYTYTTRFIDYDPEHKRLLNFL